MPCGMAILITSKANSKAGSWSKATTPFTYIFIDFYFIYLVWTDKQAYH